MADVKNETLGKDTEVEDGLIKKHKKKTKDKENDGLHKITASDEKEATLKRVLELQQQLKALRDEKEKAMEEISSLKEQFNSSENQKSKKQLNEELPNDVLSLQEQVSEVQKRLEMKDGEITHLKIRALNLSEQVEQEKETKAIFWNRMINCISEKTKLEKQYEEDTSAAADDIAQLKEHTINLTKEKHDLWAKLDLIRSDLKQKSGTRWISDEEVTECTNCKSPFTLIRRKHHCRLCGHIFCGDCSNNWLDTPHSKSQIRSCNVCAEIYMETHSRDTEDGSTDKSDEVDGSRMEAALAYIIQHGRGSRSSSFDGEEK